MKIEAKKVIGVLAAFLGGAAAYKLLSANDPNDELYEEDDFDNDEFEEEDSVPLDAEKKGNKEEK